MPNINIAIEIAKKGLRWCYRDRGIISGSRQVYWSWDSFFASLGANCLGDYEISKKNLELYLQLQKKNGCVPKRIANPFYLFRFLGFPVQETPAKQKPNYWNSYYTGPSLTQNTTLVIAFRDYLEKTGDKVFAEKYIPNLEKIFDYLDTKKYSYGLLKEGLGGGWAESVLKRGAVCFTNVCYAHSLKCMAEILRYQGYEERAAVYDEKYREVKNLINHRLWFNEDGGFYSDWLAHRRHHYFATDGNLLAILWDIASAEQAQSIQEKISKLQLEDDIPIRLAYDDYHFWRIFIVNRIGGIKDYHVGFSWTWLGCIDVLVKLKLGQKEDALKTLAKIARVIERDGTVHETYDNGIAVHTVFYKSENPWGWGSGLFILACAKAGYNLNPHNAESK